MKDSIKTFKPLFNKPQILRDVSEGIHPVFSDTYIRFLPDENAGRPMYVTKEEAERISAPVTSCPLCEAGIPLSNANPVS